MSRVSWLQLWINKFSKQRVSQKRNNLNCSKAAVVLATSGWGNCCRLTDSYALSSSSLEERSCVDDKTQAASACNNWQREQARPYRVLPSGEHSPTVLQDQYKVSFTFLVMFSCLQWSLSLGSSKHASSIVAILLTKSLQGWNTQSTSWTSMGRLMAWGGVGWKWPVYGCLFRKYQ